MADSSWRTAEKRRSPGRVAIVFASLALVALSFLYFYIDKFSKKHGDADLLSTSRTPIAVMYFENMTGNQDLDIWEQGIADLLITDLARHPKLEVLDPQTIYLTQQEHFKDIPRQWNDALALRIASSMNVAVILFGQIYQKTEQISIRVKLYDIEQEKLLGSDELLLDNMEHILDKIGTLAVKIVSFLEVLQLEKATEYYTRDTDFLAGRTRSINAYKHYIQGMQYFHKFNWNLAVDQLSNAVAYDSTYTAAYFMLGVIYANRGDVTNIHKLLENAKKAIAAPT